MPRRIASAIVAALLIGAPCAQAAAGGTGPAAPAARELPAVAHQDETRARLPACVTDKVGVKDKTFIIELTDRCELRLRCTVDAHIATSRGPIKGHRTLVLAPTSKGPAAQRSYVIQIDEDGGSANISRRCKAVPARAL